MMTREDEIKMIREIIEHPAGFDVNLFGDLLSIRSHCDGFEVSWKELNKNPYKNFDNIQEAAQFFIDKRYELQLGVDIEAELMKEKYNV